jgi:hypothetical protein
MVRDARRSRTVPKLLEAWDTKKHEKGVAYSSRTEVLRVFSLPLWFN